MLFRKKSNHRGNISTTTNTKGARTASRKANTTGSTVSAIKVSRRIRSGRNGAYRARTKVGTKKPPLGKGGNLDFF